MAMKRDFLTKRIDLMLKFILSLACLQSAASFAQGQNFEQKLAQQYQLSIQFMLKNFPQSQGTVGSVAASPTKEYQYHWTRDAALTHQALFEVYQNSNSQSLKSQILKAFQQWVGFEKRAVANAIQAGLGSGEPKFQLNGEIFKGEWGRPQNDGPAVRALVMSEWALELIKMGQKDWVLRNLYRPEIPSPQIIKSDLEFTAVNWNKASFDLWEEIKGLNFYTLAMQRKSLLIGAELATQLNDPGAAKYYLEQAQLILNLMNQYYNQQLSYIVAIRNQVDGWGHKNSNLDVAVVLGTIQGFLDLTFLSPNSKKVLQTAQKLEDVFMQIYPINKNKQVPVIGRYSEDVYDGFGFSGGNPWFISTHAHAELYCKFAKFSQRSNQAYIQKGLKFLGRTLEHRNQQTGEMSEQLSRFNGYLVGVSHLTWSYASFITAYHSCLRN
jgi:glucoamylase